MNRRYARLYATPAEIRKLTRSAERRGLSVSDYVRAALDLPPVYSRRATSSEVLGSEHHDVHRALKVRLRDDDEARSLQDRAAEIDATDCDYMRVRLKLPRLRDRRVRGGAPQGKRRP